MGPSISNGTRREASQALSNDLQDLHGFHRVQLPAPDLFKRQALRYSRHFETACLLHNTFALPKAADHDFILGLGVQDMMENREEAGGFNRLKQFCDAHRGEWILGYISYDMKNDVEKLSSRNTDHLSFPPILFFIPETIIIVHSGNCYVRSGRQHHGSVLSAIGREQTGSDETSPCVDMNVLRHNPTQREYMDTIRELLHEIGRGNIYEINFCREVTARADLDAVATFEALMADSPAPFSTFYKAGGKYLISASPERFLRKSGNRLISQPMKGTSPRFSDGDLDQASKDRLTSSLKERAENVMIVDLVRNDLSRTAQTGSVRTDELFGVYSYPHVHQMISTISSELRDDCHWVDAIKACFPMGSMTGAPKLKAMELIENHEKFRRGMFSGSVGYITPGQNFDFNVVIRSVLYNETNQHISLRTGSAITALSAPEAEWEECELKARALVRCLRLKSSDR